MNKYANEVNVIALAGESHGTSEREAGRSNLVKANKIPSDTRSGGKWKKSPASSPLVAAVWAIAPLFLAAMPLIIFGSARTFVIREKSPSGIVLNVHTSGADGSEATTCHVSFGENDLLLVLARREALTFVKKKSECFIKNVASAHPNQHRPESGRNYARC